MRVLIIATNDQMKALLIKLLITIFFVTPLTKKALADRGWEFVFSPISASAHRLYPKQKRMFLQELKNALSNSPYYQSDETPRQKLYWTSERIWMKRMEFFAIGLVDYYPLKRFLPVYVYSPKNPELKFVTGAKAQEILNRSSVPVYTEKLFTEFTRYSADYVLFELLDHKEEYHQRLFRANSSLFLQPHWLQRTVTLGYLQPELRLMHYFSKLTEQELIDYSALLIDELRERGFFKRNLKIKIEGESLYKTLNIENRVRFEEFLANLIISFNLLNKEILQVLSSKVSVISLGSGKNYCHRSDKKLLGMYSYGLFRTNKIRICMREPGKRYKVIHKELLETIIHEMGHALYRNLSSGLKDDYESISWVDENGKKRKNISYQNFPSWYASTSVHEDFAESFAFFYTHSLKSKFKKRHLFFRNLEVFARN